MSEWIDRGDRSDLNVEEEILRTSGLSSRVYSFECGEEIDHGHILMIEWDDIDDVFRPVSDLQRLPGVSILLQSSDQSWHGYNLGIRSFEEQITDAARKSGDLHHIRSSARRGYFVLRILEKIREESGEVYKPAPQIVDVFASGSDLPQSRAHMQLFVSIAKDQGADCAEELEEILSGSSEETYTWIGSDIDVDHYQTGTDEVSGRSL